MPSVLSKIPLPQSFQNKALSGALLVLILMIVKSKKEASSPRKIPRKYGQGNVDKVFINRIMDLLKIVIPSIKSMEIFDLSVLTVFLVIRTMMSIYISSLNGRIVKTIINGDFQKFIQKIVQLGLVAVPASFVNSYLEYLNKSLSLRFRRRLTEYFHDQYIKNMIFYQVSNLDSRVSNPDQRLTTDIEKWANSLSQIYSNFSKPILDIILFSKKLAVSIGYQGPMYVFLWYFFSGVLLKLVSPAFGKLTAIDQKLEGEYRNVHSQLLYHAEEVAFLQGQNWEKLKINQSYSQLNKHQILVNKLRLFMGIFDGLLVKYGAVMAGYGIMGLPVFGPNREEYLKKIGNDKSAITRDYVSNSSLLINLAKAIGRLVVSYKEIQQLAGYTRVVYEIKEVLSDLTNGYYRRTQVQGEKETGQLQVDQQKHQTIQLDKGQIIQTEDIIEFDNVPIISPNGDTLIKGMSFKITPGMNVIISGPNGCGKSSLFRILGALWPVQGGTLYRPVIDKLFYIPQRPYLPPGTLRDQIIYPHTKLQMLRRKINDQDLNKLLEDVQLDYLILRERGLDANNDWNDILSGGEKQRIAMARLFYHKPQYAILDECTSSVSMDIEAIMYNKAKALNITLFTVSHRQSLFKFHEYILKFDGEGKYWFNKQNI
ncbi:unnamed protein product [Paramecium sonneborni]|uniref:Uncharacterized protein n=1 Tax=Paramecium sonneborni TaxID=65129 RepID=A0A8S1M993_9CILI|nr:unnamed protein product [Paramecium sonneborni]